MFKMFLLLLIVQLVTCKRDPRCDDENLSAKARFLYCSESTNDSEKKTTIEESTLEKSLSDDDYYDEEFYRERESIFIPEDPVTFTVPVVTTPNSFMDDEENPFCSDLMPGFDDMTNCRNKTEPEIEVRWRDTVFEKLIRQAWRDTQTQINNMAEVGGVILDPLDVDKLAGSHPPVDISDSNIAYSADLKMWDLQVHGLSTIYINEALVTRSKNLFDIDVKVVFKFDTLTMNGTYDLTGSLGGWFGTSFTSDGARPFYVEIENATITARLKLDTSETLNLECDRVGDVLMTDIGIPFTYDDISINFDNLGYTYNTVINGMSIFILKTQEKNLLTYVKDQVKSIVNSLIC